MNILLIDKRVNGYEDIVAAVNCELAVAILFDYYEDTFETIKQRINDIVNIGETVNVGASAAISIGIVQHNYKTPTFSMVSGALTPKPESMADPMTDPAPPTCILHGVAERDPELSSWEPFKDFIVWCKTECGAAHFDMMACALYVDSNWRYVIDTLELQTGVDIRASYDNTGASDLGGNWFLETDNANLKEVYFTNAIEEYKGVLYSYNNHTILVDTNNIIWGTGYNAQGQLGDGTTVNKNTLTQMTAVSGKTPKQVSCGGYHTTVLMTDGTIYGTGSNNAGQFGDGTTSDKLTLTQMTAVSGKTPNQVYCGSHHTMVLMTDGTIYGTGFNGNGQLGDGTSVYKKTLTQMTAVSGKTPKRVYCGSRYTIVIMTDGTIYGTGSNAHGELGDGTTGDKLTLTQMTAVSGKTPKRVSCGEYHTAVLMTDGTIYGTGYNGHGQLGHGTSVSKNTLTQMTAVSGKTPKEVSCGDMHTAVLMTDGTIYGTGYNANGQLGDGTSVSKNTLTQMTAVSGKTPKHVSCGVANTLVLMTDGTIYGTGYNAYGQLGDGTATNRSYFTKVPGTLLFTNKSFDSYLVKLTATLNANTPTSIKNITETGTYNIADFFTSNVSATYITYSTPANNFCTVSSSGTITLTGTATSGGAATITATIASGQTTESDHEIDNTVTATHTIQFLRTPVLNGFNAGVTSITRYYSDIGGTFTVTSPTSVTPSDGTPSYSYSIVYATNGPPATPITASIQSSSSASATINVVATGQCAIRVTKTQDLANFLDTAFADVFLTVRAGYIVGPNVDLSGALIQNYDLSGTNLSGVNFTNASIINCILKNVNLTSTNFTNATFTYNTVDSSTNLVNANFENLFSNNNVGTTTQISTTYTIRSGQIVKTGTILFAITFTLVTPSATIPTTPTLGGSAGYYAVASNAFLVNGRPETSTVASNLIAKAVDTTYELPQTGITPTYKFTIYLNSVDNTFYVRGNNISNNTIVALPNVYTEQTFAVSFLVTTPISPYKLLGSYIFGPNMSLAGVYFDNNISPKPDLTDLPFVNLTLANNSRDAGQIVLQGWNFTRASLNTGNFSNILFKDCICNATDFSGSNLSNSSFTISYDSDSTISAVPNTATMVNAKFTNATITNLTIAGFNNNTSVAANQMNINGLDFSGCTIDGLKSYFLAGTPLRLKNAYGGAEYTILTDSLIGRFIAGPTMNLSGLTLGNVAFSQTNFAGSNIYGTKLSTTTMSGVRVSNGRLTYSSLTTTLPSNFKIVNPLLSANQQQYTVTNSGTSAYVISGQNNPTLVLTRGARYVFNISASGHPFWIKTAPTIGTGDAYESGVTNNGISSGSGTTTFIVPNDAPNTLYYKSEINSSMGGILTISDEINTYPTYIIGPGADLSGANATGVVFTGANISGANFTNAIFTNVVSGQLALGSVAPTLPSAYYSIIGGYFVGPYVDLSGSIFAGQSLANTNLTGVNFTNSNLTGVTSGGISSTATISDVTATVAPTMASGYGLTGGYIIGPNMNFTGADLSGFDFTNVNLSGTNFTGANITYVKSGNTLSSGSTILPDANYVFLNNFLLGPKVNLSSKDLSGIQLYNLTLSGSILVNTNLSYADISGTIIDGINFTGATFTRTRSRNIPQPTVAPTFTAGTAGGYVVRSGYLIGANVDLSSVNFTGFDLSNTVLTNVNLSNATFVNTRSGGITLNSLLPPSLPAKYKVVGGYLHGPRVDLSGANLTSYDFSTQASSVNWSAANLTNATFTNMKSGWITADTGTEIKIEPLSFNQVVAAYSFDNNSNDASPNQNHITNVGNVTYNTSDYKSGSAAASFNGSNYFEVANDGRFSPDNFTISFWIKPVTRSGQFQSIASCRGAIDASEAGRCGWMIYIGYYDDLQFWTGNPVTTFSGNHITLYSNFGALGTWTHLAFTLNRSTGEFITYMNGNIIATGTRIYEPNTTTNLRIGAGANEFTPAQFPVGNGTLMDDFRIYNRVLSSFGGPILSYPYVYNRLVSANPSGGFIIGPNVSLNGAILTNYDLRNVIDIAGVDFTNAALTGVKTSGAITANGFGGITYYVALPNSITHTAGGYTNQIMTKLYTAIPQRGVTQAIGANSAYVIADYTTETINKVANPILSGVQQLNQYVTWNSNNQVGKLYGNLYYRSLTPVNNVMWEKKYTNPVVSNYGSTINGTPIELPASSLGIYLISVPRVLWQNIDVIPDAGQTASITLRSEALINGTWTTQQTWGHWPPLYNTTHTGLTLTFINFLFFTQQLGAAPLHTGFRFSLVCTNGQIRQTTAGAAVDAGAYQLLSSPDQEGAFEVLLKAGENNKVITPYSTTPTLIELDMPIDIPYDISSFNNSKLKIDMIFIQETGGFAGHQIELWFNEGSITHFHSTIAEAGPTFTSGSGYVLYAGRIFGPGVDVSGTDLSGLVFGTSAAAVAAGSTSALSATNFTNANLTRTSFFGSVVTGTLFTGSTFFRTRTGGLSFVTTAPAMPTSDYRYVNTDVSGGYIIGPNVDLSGTNLRGAIFDNTNFKNVDMSGALITNSTSNNVTFDASTNLPQGYKFVTNTSQVSFIAGPNISLAGKSLDGAILANVDLTNTNLTNAGALATTFNGTRSGGITFTSGNPPLFQSGSGYQIRGGYLIGPGVDLSNITVSTLAAANGVAYGAGLAGLDLSGANLVNAKFTGSDLSGVDLSGTALSFTDFSGANFINIKSGGKITFTTQPTLPSESYRIISNGYSESSAAFQRYIIGPGANCRGADLSGAVFTRVDLSGIDFTGANFTRVSSGIMRNQPILSSLPTGFQLVVGVNTQDLASQDPSYNNATYFVGPTAMLTSAFLKNASIVNCDITGANFTNADFTNLYSRGLTNSPSAPATMPNASYFVKGGYIFGPTVNLSGGDFTGLDLSGASLIRATMRNANFTNVNLTNANISNADLAGSTLAGATTVGVIYQGYNYGGDLSLQDPTFPAPYRYVYSSQAGYGCIIGPYVILSGADLRGSNLSYTNITGANLVGANITIVRSVNITIDNGIQPIFTPGSGFKVLSGYLIGPYADLTNIIFTDQDFSGTNLTGVNFTNSLLLNIKSGNIVATPVMPIFPDTTFSLRGGYIIGPSVDLSNSDLSGIDLSNVTVTNANMINSNFVNVKTGGVKGTTPLLKPSYMQRNGYIIGAGVDLSGADLSGQNLSNAVFSDANVTNMVFTNTILTNVRSGGNMRYSALTTSRLPTKYTIRGTYILGPGVDLSGEDLTGLDISNTFLSGANLSAVNFSGMRSGGIEMITTSPMIFSDPAFYNGSEYGYKYLNGYIVGPGVNLSGADFSGVNISAVDVSGANISNAVLTRIKSSNVVGVPSAITTGYKVTARHVVGPGLDMRGYDFTNGNFSGVDISGSNLTNAIFTNTSSGGVTGSSETLFTTTTLPVNVKYQLTQGYIVGPSVNLTGDDLSGVDVSGINLTGATLYDAITGKVIHNSETVLPSVDYTFIGDYIVGPNVNLSLVDFSGADLRYTNLTNVNFGSANLTNVRSGNIIGTPRQLPPSFSFISGFIVGPSTDLSGADLSGGNLSGCNIQGADLTNANFYNVRSGGVTGTPRVPLTAPYAITTNGYVIGPNVNLGNANFASINLQGLDITNAIMTGAIFTNAKFGNNIGPPRSLTTPYIYVQTVLSGGYVVGPYIDLSRANLSYANIAQADLTGANLGTAIFYRTRSGNMNATGAPSALTANYSILPTTVSGGYLIGPNVDLNDANFSGSGTVLTGRNISGALMERIAFNGTRIGGGGLIGPPSTLSSDFRYIESSVSGGYIIGPNIDLSGANFKNTDMSFVRVDGVNFTNANFTNTITGRLIISSAASASPTVLTSPYRLIMSTLSGGYIVGPNVNMTGANLAFTDISNTVLTGVNLTNASFTRTKTGLLTATAGALPTLSPSYRYVTTTSSGGYIVGPTMDLTRANLVGSDLSYISIYGCDISQAILPSTLTYIRSGGLVNANPPAVLPSPYLFITNEASGAYIVGPYADLSGANLESSIITGADVSSADFTNARLKYVRSGGMVNAHPPAVLPSPYLFIPNDASGAYIVGPYVDLSGANLESSIITGADISSADFTNARLKYVRSGGMVNSHPPAVLPSPYLFIPNDASGAYIVGPYADLSGANLESSIITGADISSADFTRARLKYVRSGGMVNSRPPAVLPSPYLFIPNEASGAYIVGPYSDLSGANLEGSVITGADISSADFTRARLKYIRSGGMVNSHPPVNIPSPYLFIPNDASGAYIVGPYADLSGANLEGSVITGADISGANFTRARLRDLKSGNLSAAGRPAVLPTTYTFNVSAAPGYGGYVIGTGVNISGAVLDGTDLSGVVFTDANMQGASLAGGGTSLVNARSGGIRGIPASLPPGYTFVNDNSSGGYIVGRSIDLSGANLTNCVLSGLDVSGANLTGAIMANAKTGPNLIGPPAYFPSPAYSYIVSSASGGFIIGPNANIEGANLTGLDLSGFNFKGMNITGVDFSGTNLINVKSGGTIGPPSRLPSPYVFMTDNSFGAYIVGPRVDLSGVNLTNCRFTGLNISGASFTNAVLINVKSGGGMVGPPAPGALPPKYRFVVDTDNSGGIGGDGTGGYFIGPGVDLSGASLRNQSDSELNLSGAYFTDANITNARFSGSAMPRVKSGGMTGPPASLPNGFTFVVSASGGYFIGPYSDLTNANLNSTVLTGMNITRADLTGATFVNTLTGALAGPPDAITAGYHYVLRSPAPSLDAYIVGPRVNLTSAVLNGTNLTNYDMSGVNLTNAVFTGTNFTNTNIFGSNLTGAAAFTNTQRMQLLKNINNRGITKAQVTQCLGGEIDIIAATSTTPNTHTYNPIYDYIRDIMVDILTPDTSGNSNLSRYTGRAFYIPSSPGESFYVDASATGPLIVAPAPSNTTPQYYYDGGRDKIIETATENTIRSISVGGRIFLVFGGSMLGLVMDDVYSALGFPPIYKTYAYYGVRNMILPPQIPVVHAVLGNGQMSLNWEPSFYDGKPRLGYVIEYTTRRPVANVYSEWITYSEQYALTNVTIFGLINGTRYYIRVAAINPVGRGPYSPIAEIVPGTTPNAITTLFVNGGNNALTLEWVTPYDQGYAITSYIIKYKVISGNPSEDDANAFTLITVSASGLTVDATKRTCAYTLTQAANGIVDGITYDVQIAAVNDIGSGEFGAMIAPNPAFAVPGIRPAIILASTVISSLVMENMGGKIRLSWLPPAMQGDLSVYAYSIQSVEVAVGAGIAPPPIADASWNVVSPATYALLPDNARGNGSVYAIISGLANGKSYTFRIAAVSGIGRGPYSQPIPAVVPGSVPATLVSTQMGVTVDTAEGGKLTLFWNAAKANGYAVTAYRARIRTDAMPITWSESQIISVPSGIVNTLPYRNQLFSGLTNGRAYYMGVAAQNALGWSEYSETIAETPRTVPQPPLSITSAPLNEALRVQWAGNGASDGGYPVIGYRLQYRPVTVSTPDTWLNVDLSGIYITNRDIMNLNNGITYNLRVLRRNAIGFSSPSSEISGIPGTVSGPPINLFLSPGPQHIDVYWQPPIDNGTNDVDYYYVQYKLASAADSEYAYLNNDAGTAPKQVTQFTTVPNAPGYDGYVATIINITNGLTYSLRVAAVTRVGIGAWSTPLTSVPGTVPSQIE